MDLNQEKKIQIYSSCYKTLEFLVSAECCPPFMVLKFDDEEEKRDRLGVDP
jgi:hypothetical protein